jgi:acetyl esterase/lipase
VTATTYSWTSLAAILLGVVALTCSPTWASDPTDPTLQRTERTPPPTMSDVAYGKLERQTLDFWRSDADQPTPVMIYFHGGGFKKGSKKQISRDIRVDEYVKNGISCISVSYPFSDTLDIPSICKECEGVITFVRSKVKEWNIDPNRIGVSGCSAGAIIAFWIGTQKPDEVSVIGATQQPLGTALLIPHITAKSPPCIIYQQDPEKNKLHGPVNAQLIKDAYAKHGVECQIYGAGTNKFAIPPEGKDKFAIMMEFYMRTWGMVESGDDRTSASKSKSEPRTSQAK